MREKSKKFGLWGSSVYLRLTAPIVVCARKNRPEQKSRHNIPSAPNRLGGVIIPSNQVSAQSVPAEQGATAEEEKHTYEL